MTARDDDGVEHSVSARQHIHRLMRRCSGSSATWVPETAGPVPGGGNARKMISSFLCSMTSRPRTWRKFQPPCRLPNLSLNDLVTNAAKYAFAGRDKGEIVLGYRQDGAG